MVTRNGDMNKPAENKVQKSSLYILHSIRMPPAILIEDSRVHLLSIKPRWCTGRRKDHMGSGTQLCASYVKRLALADLLITISLRQFQIVQSKAQTPTLICALVFFCTALSQFPNELVTLVGGEIL